MGAVPVATKHSKTEVEGFDVGQIVVDFKEPSDHLAETLFKAYAKISEVTEEAEPILRVVWFSGAVAMFNTVININTGLPKEQAIEQMERLQMELARFMASNPPAAGATGDE